MDKDKAKKIAIGLMKKHGLITDFFPWTFKFDNAKRRFGSCDERSRLITLSLSLTELNEEAEVTNTILHEIAHALAGCVHGHNWVWKQKALEIGCTGDRCYKSSEVVTPTGNYVAICKNGHSRSKMRKPKRTMSCGKCSRKFDPNNVLVWNRV
jgi:predicted SprT family Zn-dependent metalloprotease